MRQSKVFHPPRNHCLGDAGVHDIVELQSWTWMQLAFRALLGGSLRLLLAPHLLCLEILVEQEKCHFVGLGSSHYGEHSLASLIVWSLSNAALVAKKITKASPVGRRDMSDGVVPYLGYGNPGARGLADLANLGTRATDNAANHVGGDADVLCLDLLAVLVVGRWAAAGSDVRVRTLVIRSLSTVAEISPISCPHDARAGSSSPLSMRSMRGRWYSERRKK